jgi:hypothetical protein
MPHRAFWAPYAEERFEQYLKASSEPAELAAVARQIDRYLAIAPQSFGESRHDTIRIGFVFPLGVQFEVMDDVQTVIVHDVWRVDRQGDVG